MRTGHALLLVLCRFGVDALRLQLSRQLVELTQTEMPRMKEAIDATLQQVCSYNTSYHGEPVGTSNCADSIRRGSTVAM